MSLKSMSHGQCHSIAPNVFHSTASNVIQLTVSNVNDMLSTNRSMPVKSMDMINITTLSLGVDITDVRVTPVEFLTPNNGAWVDLQPAVPLSIFSTFDEEKQDGLISFLVPMMMIACTPFMRPWYKAQWRPLPHLLYALPLPKTKSFKTKNSLGLVGANFTKICKMMSPAGKGNFSSSNLSLVHGHFLCTKALLDPHNDVAAAAENLLAHYMTHHACAQEEKW